MLYFSRIGSDTTHDGEITPEDRSVVCRINTEMPDSIPFPVTPLSQVAFKPYPAAGRIYFLSSRAGVSNCWAVPEEGFIRTAKTAAAQLNSAEIIAGRIPYDPYLSLLACIRVIEKFPDQAAVAAAAGFQAGKPLSGTESSGVRIRRVPVCPYQIMRTCSRNPPCLPSVR